MMGKLLGVFLPVFLILGTGASAAQEPAPVPAQPEVCPLPSEPQAPPLAGEPEALFLAPTWCCDIPSSSCFITGSPSNCVAVGGSPTTSLNICLAVCT